MDEKVVHPTEPLSKHHPDPAPVVAIVGADKGGVGKTMTTRALIDYAQSRGISVRAIDTQVPRGDLKKFFPAAEVVDIESAVGQSHIFDSPAPMTVIDIGANLLGKTIDMLEQVGVIRDVQAGSMQICLFYLMGPSVSSLTEVVEAHKAIGRKLRVYFVRNHMNKDDFFGWEGDERFAEALELMKPLTIDIPNLRQEASETVNREGKLFSQFVRERKSRIFAGYVEDWLSRVYGEFERLHIAETLQSR